MCLCCECCVLSGIGLCDELITRPEESYRLWCVVVCDLETSRMRRTWPKFGHSVQKKNMIKRNWNVTFFAPPNQLAPTELLAAYLFSNRTDTNYWHTPRNQTRLNKRHSRPINSSQFHYITRQCAQWDLFFISG